MTWQTHTEPLDSDEGRKVTFLKDRTPLSYDAIYRLWQSDAAFRDCFIDCLAEAPYAAYFWETPPVNRETAEQPFEFVLIPSPALESVTPDPGAFAEHFDRAGENVVVSFPNLGGDAELVVPTPRAAPDCYPHLATFTRLAPRDQQHALWRMVGERLARQMGDRPQWLSTAGLGVYWVHIRLDTWPKYYQHGPYRRFPPM